MYSNKFFLTNGFRAFDSFHGQNYDVQTSNQEIGF